MSKPIKRKSSKKETQKNVTKATGNISDTDLGNGIQKEEVLINGRRYYKILAPFKYVNLTIETPILTEKQLENIERDNTKGMLDISLEEFLELDKQSHECNRQLYLAGIPKHKKIQAINKMQSELVDVKLVEMFTLREIEAIPKRLSEKISSSLHSIDESLEKEKLKLQKTDTPRFKKGQYYMNELTKIFHDSGFSISKHVRKELQEVINKAESTHDMKPKEALNKIMSIARKERTSRINAKVLEEFIMTR